MIQTFRCKHTAALFSGKEIRKWATAFQLLALRKLEMLNARTPSFRGCESIIQITLQTFFTTKARRTRRKTIVLIQCI